MLKQIPVREIELQDNTIKLIEFAPYLQLLVEILPTAEGFVVCDASGIPVFVSDEMLQKEFQELAADCGPELHHGQRDLQPVSICNVQGKKAYFRVSVVTSSQRLVGFVGAVVPCEKEGMVRARGNQIINQLVIVAKCLSKEFELTTELNNMASELAGRYEELNLLYIAEGEVEHANQDGDVLKPFLNSCVEHLDVGLAALIMPKKNIVLFSTNKDRPITDANEIIPALCGKFYDWLQTGGETVILNEFADQRRAIYCPDIPYKILACPVLDSDQNVIGMLATLNYNYRTDFLTSDRSLLRALAKKISKIIQVRYDTLTGLINRSVFEAYLEDSLAACRKSSMVHCVLNIDVDQLQVINDTVEHSGGDEVIKRVAVALTENVRDADVVGYLGRGKFAVLLKCCPVQQGQDIAENLRKSVEDLEIDWRGQRIETSISIGIVQMSIDFPGASEVLDATELARDAAKEMGRNRVQVYMSEDSEITRRKDHMQWVGRIQSALREDRFVLYCQSIQPGSSDSKEQHIEILLRMLDEHGVIVEPGAFIPAAERYHLMPTVDRWVVANALNLLAGTEFEHQRGAWVCAINLSGQSLVDDGFTQFLIDKLDASPVPAENICFEITETAAISDIDAAKRFILAIRAKGCSFSLDDFGTGLSSFTYLKLLPVDYLKIDGSFVRHIVDDPVAEAMVSAINHVGHVMGLKTIAEFVESKAIRERLRALGIDYVQGYAIGMPGPLADHLENLQKYIISSTG